MADLDDRYGRRSASRRWIWPAVAAIGIAGAVTWAAWVAFQPRPVNGVLWAYEVVDEHRVQVTLEIHRPDPIAVECTVFAQAEDHSVVGERTVVVPARNVKNTRITTSIKTERRAVNGVLRGCRPRA
ncbi:MAG TPA: DUF4307 domain-containing protein [Aeromicrobium sp.]|nr:DUF4307 domain-containing protein [Aeromicrobium sp.]HKY57789.1 DUF4307 domain-containing protein [Aeromicrobium sp.]